MSQTLSNRLTTVPQQSFLNCVSLSIREEDLNTSELDGLHGGNRLVQFVIENIPKAYNQAHQAISRGLPPVVQATAAKVEEIADTLGDAASEGWDSAKSHAAQLCNTRTWERLAGLP